MTNHLDTYLSLANVGGVDHGRLAHCNVVKYGLMVDGYVRHSLISMLGKVVEVYVVEKEIEVISYVGSALIGMYIKCGDLVSAKRVFDKMGRKDLVTWNAMIT
nr:hypothetical protein [Tanacetum cinerariifolium]